MENKSITLENLPSEIRETADTEIGIMVKPYLVHHAYLSMYQG